MMRRIGAASLAGSCRGPVAAGDVGDDQLGARAPATPRAAPSPVADRALGRPGRCRRAGRAHARASTSRWSLGGEPVGLARLRLEVEHDDARRAVGLDQRLAQLGHQQVRDAPR